MAPSRSIWIAVAISTVVALAAVTAPAAAAGSSTSHPAEPVVVPAFTFHATRGYLGVGFFVGAHDGHPSQMLLILGRKHDSVTYLTPAEVEEDGVHADLGALGIVDLEFVANGTAGKASSHCGDPVAYAKGRYEGTISFRGEEGFTQVETDHAAPFPGLLANIVCAGGGYGYTVHGKGGQLVAKTRSGSLAFKAIKRAPRAGTHFSARINERHGDLSISRYTTTVGAAGDFAFPRRGQRVRISPPAPFSGSAALRGGRWRGNLEVDFPGHSNVRLTGPGFRASLLHATFSGSIARGLE